MFKLSQLGLVLVVCLLAGTANAQQKKPSPTPPPKPEETPEVIRISTELVQTDVMVFDKQGKFVNGLKQDQFELLVDGKPQPIALFESIVTGARSERAALKAARDNKPAPAVEQSENVSEHGRTMIFFVNDLNLDPGGLARTHKTITYFIDKQMGPNDQVAITSASGQIGFLQQLTNNRAVLRAALDRLKFVPGGARDMQRPSISDYAAYLVKERNDRELFEALVTQTLKANGMNDPRDRPIASAMVQSRIDNITRTSAAMVKTSLSSLANLMNSTAKLTGRKLVVFISDGFTPFFTSSDFTTMMSRVTTAAGRGGAVVYTIDARGLATDPAYDAGSGGAFDPSGFMQTRLSGELSFSQEPLHALAADTGGRALLNSNDFQAGIARAMDETSRYYLLAWRPTSDAQRASNFSKIKVTIADRPDLKVQLRRGYFAPAPDKAKAQASVPVQVETAADDLGLTESNEEIHTALAVGYKQTAGGNLQLNISVQVNAVSPDDSSGKIESNVLGAVFDSRGKPVGSFKRQLEVPRTPAKAPAYATVNHQVDVPPGLYQVRVFAYERGTTKLNAALEWIEIPKLKPAAFSISSVFVGEISEAGDAGQVTVNANRRFARSSRMRFTTYIYNAGHNPAPQLAVQIKILRGEQAVITPPEIKVSTDKVTNFANIPYTGEFPLSSLPPGSYVLQVTVMDRTSTASDSQQLRFTVY